MFKNTFEFSRASRQILSRALRLWTIALVLIAVGVSCIGAGVWRFLSRVDASAVLDSSAMASLDAIGRSLRDDIARVVRPAMDRTQRLARDPQLVAAILEGNQHAQTEACNRVIADSTEIDAVALFNRAGKILAINTNYASGAPIAKERVDQVMRRKFDGREIIHKCARNAADETALEFQTTCDITPAFFDSTGLSIAYSVPIKSGTTGEKIGVASSRLRFERLTDMIRSRETGGRKFSIEFVTDRGGYFSEKINGGRVAAPIAPSVLAEIVKPLASGETDSSFSHLGTNYLLLFRLKDFVTLTGGGIQVMVMANDAWLAREAQQTRAVNSAGITVLGLLFLLLAALTIGIAQLRGTQRSLQSDLEERRRINSMLQQEVTDRVRAERKVESVHQQLMEVSRRSGMAEIATGVLHNVGNVLNSVNVSTGLVLERLRQSSVDHLARVSGMIEQNRADLGQFVTQDPRGRQVPDFLKLLAGNLVEERAGILEEVEGLASKVDHIKTIVAAQHSYAGVSGVIEPTDLLVLLNDALKINTTAFERHGVQVEHEFADLPMLLIDKQKVLQIVVNLVKNAKEAMLETAIDDRHLTVQTEFAGNDRFQIVVQDSGAGITRENLTQVFTYGFTTKKTGHGFGLHSCANAAKEMGGSLTAYSDGSGTGATFTLELPLQPAEEHAWTTT